MFEERYSLVAMKNGSVGSETSLPVTSGGSTENISLNVERHSIVRCEDPDCPDYGKLIEVFDGVYCKFPFHMERVDGYLYHIQINNEYGKFGLTRKELNTFMAGIL